MIITAAHSPSTIDEMAQADVEAAPSINVKPPRVKASPIAMECKLLQVVELPSAPDGGRNNVVIGQVVGIHVDDDVIDDGIIDVAKINPLARLGYLDYATLDLNNLFSLRPSGGDPRFKSR